MTRSIVPGLSLGFANTRYDWNYTSIPQLGLNNRSLSIQRGYILGGSSSVSEYRLYTMSNPGIYFKNRWYGVYARFLLGL